MDSVAAHSVAAAVEGLLLAPILRPMIDGAGVLGDYGLDLLAQEIARRDDGFTALIAANLERHT